MGHSPSKSSFDSEAMVSRYANDDSEERDTVSPINRRASGLPSIRTHNLRHNSNDRLGAQPHRRTRSAIATPSQPMVDQTPAAPPPYSAIAEFPPPLPPRPNPRPPHHPLIPQTTPQAPPKLPSDNSAVPVPATQNSYLRTPMRQRSTENALETLRKYNTVFVVDDSRSMFGSLWKEARNALASLAEHAQKYDTDGIDVFFLNSSKTGSNLRSSSAVKRLFDSVIPKGITPMAEKLESLLLPYLSALESAKDLADAGDTKPMKGIKPVNYIVITDGVPTDDPESVIVSAARRLDARHFPITQVGIQFVQIGDSPQATEFLKELDDGLSANHGIRDIVDTTPYTGGELNAEILTKILLGGINRRVDRRGGGSVLS